MTPLCNDSPSQTCIWCKLWICLRWWWQNIPTYSNVHFQGDGPDPYNERSVNATGTKATKWGSYDGHPWWKLRIFLLNCGFVYSTAQCRFISVTVQHIKKLKAFPPNFLRFLTQHFWTDTVRKLVMWSSLSWLSEIFVLTAWGHLAGAAKLYMVFCNCCPLEVGALLDSSQEPHTHICIFLKIL